MNLVTNAFEAMTGPGQLTVATRCEERAADSTGFFCGIPAANHAAARYVMLEVADTGEGIPADRLGSIFEPFVSSKVLGRSGSGLGLSVVYGVLQDMDGHVDVQSEPGRGTRFLVGLPTCHAVGTAQESAEAGELAGTGTVLIIDDLASQRMLGARVLGALGYSALTAGHCAEALRVLSESGQVDLVLIDMLMQDHPDGLDTFRAIQAVRPGLPCIIVSGYAASDRIQTACAEGAFGLVKKPYTQQSLGMAIRRALGAGPGADGRGG
jgi:CheY-like chemotaxis protein